MIDSQTASVELSLDWESAFGNYQSSEQERTDSASDALIMSLLNRGKVDIEYIIQITGKEYNSVISALKGAIYQNPDKWEEDNFKGWEPAEEYLSGNLRSKLISARNANAIYHGRFLENVYAIRNLLPKSVTSKDIYVTLGSPWIPVDIIEAFVAYILHMSMKWKKLVSHDEYTGSWEIHDKSYYAFRYSVAAKNTYGTARMDALEILEHTLNMRTVAVYDEYKRFTGKKRVINRQETALALEKQQKLISKFQKWVWNDETRSKRLISIFEDKYGCMRRRLFDGSFLKFPGMSDTVNLYPYQKNAVARIIFSPNTLLAHDVGSGKTYVMIAAGMELRRMGLSKKNLYVVPNNIVMQWKGLFEAMYPDARVFCVDAKNFTPDCRESTLEKVRDGDFDAIIMAYSCFDRIPISKSFLIRELQDAKARIREIEDNGNKLTKALKRKKEQLDKAVLELLEEIDMSENMLCFDDLGITRLFVDEAHNYKNVPIETKTSKVLGISATGSKKCKNMMDKVHYIQKQNDGGGVIFATGTPITNSLTDIYIMQKYLQSGELAMLDLQSFDSWIGMFAEKVTDFEIDVDASGYRLATRFSKFHNLPELTALLSSIADFHCTSDNADIPIFSGYNDTLIRRSGDLTRYFKKISSRAEMVRERRVDVKEDNMLKITTDGRKAALDIRLVCDEAELSCESKLAKCAENVFAMYMQTMDSKGTQLIFCDISTPKEDFNVYDEIKKLLLHLGVKDEHIAFVHDATTEKQREALFSKVRNGEVRILLGSTFKLGMGVNVQDRLIAIHHLDVPWRPADMTQREGRILRQGNKNREVYIYRYITEGSFDAYSWQLLETKQRFISEILEGSLSERSTSDVDNTVLNYAEVKALAVGNHLIKERVKTANELSRILALHRKAIETHIELEKELQEIPDKIANQSNVAQKCLSDVRAFEANRLEHTRDERRELKQKLADAILEHINKSPNEEVFAMKYCGFDIVLPANISQDKPYLWLRNEGNYYLELGESFQGAIVRVDNFLEKLNEHYQKMLDDLETLKIKQEALKEELSCCEDYSERIADIKLRLEKIDKKLGVTKQ